MQERSQPPTKILRRRDVLALLGVSATTLWRWTNEQHLFPKPIQLGPNVIGWREDTVRRWLEERERA